MFARVTTVQIAAQRRAHEPTTVDESLEMWRRSVAEVKRSRQGFVEALVLLDRAHDRVRTITLWETDEDMRSIEADGLYTALTHEFADAISEPPVIEHFEVGMRLTRE